ncbi:MAG TPA: CPBP family glutamic-type intramembrane protease [Bryobacteraceae bacterium]|nr:CPBP family glutamic-type intramembrane protease [Bryobacteraceae bacterium]
MGQPWERGRALGEALGVFGLILWYIWRLRFVWPAAWIPMLGVVVLSHALRRESPASLGFRLAGAGSPFAEFGPVVGLLCLLLAGAGSVLQTLRAVRWEDALGSLALYCLWGLFQQYLLNGYFVNRFRQAFPGSETRGVPALAAVFFSAAHLPNWFLMAVTLAAGYACAKVYLRYRNLYFLGVAHGVIGFLIYLAVPDAISHHLYVGPKWFRGR